MTQFKTTALFALIAASIAAHRPAQAGIIVTTQTNPSQTFFPAAGDDLINAGAATLSAETHTGFTPFEFKGGLSNTAALNDGLIGAAWSNPSDALQDTAAAFDETNFREFDVFGVAVGGTAPVPEPSSLLLFVTGAVSLARIGRRRFGISGKRLRWRAE